VVIDMSEAELKSALYDHCMNYVNERMKNIRSAMDNARESANDDSKSSAGDKHETGRSMAQLEQEKLSIQLLETEKLLNTMNRIERGKISTAISTGSLVYTDNGNYFISISAGRISIEGLTCIAISTMSPIGSALLNAKETQAFNFNGQIYRIKSFC
jgi:transcription elongation GreA/GreB family factor